jgi:hypothetical protein
MRHHVTLTVTSLLSILFFSLHLSDDIVRGFEPGGFKNVSGILILAVWLYATLALVERRVGLVIMLLASILGSGVPLAHMRGAGLVGGRIVGSDGTLLWVWTLVALGVTASVSVALSARGLWSLRARKELS